MDATTVVAALSGGALGAIGTAIYTTSHERAERFRERMLGAAENFLTLVEDAEEAISRSGELRALLHEAVQGVEDALDSILSTGEDAESEKELVALLVQSREFTRALNNYVKYSDEVATERLGRAATDLSGLRDSLADDDGPQKQEVAVYLERVEEYVRRARQAVDAAAEMWDAIDRVSKVVSRIRILFARGKRDDEVTSGAFEIAMALAVWARAAGSPGASAEADAGEREDLGAPVIGPMNAEETDGPEGSSTGDSSESETPESEKETDEVSARLHVHRHVGEFASHVSARVRKRWL